MQPNTAMHEARSKFANIHDMLGITVAVGQADARLATMPARKLPREVFCLEAPRRPARLRQRHQVQMCVDEGEVQAVQLVVVQQRARVE